MVRIERRSLVWRWNVVVLCQFREVFSHSLSLLLMVSHKVNRSLHGVTFYLMVILFKFLCKHIIIRAFQLILADYLGKWVAGTWSLNVFVFLKHHVCDKFRYIMVILVWKSVLLVNTLNLSRRFRILENSHLLCNLLKDLIGLGDTILLNFVFIEDLNLISWVAFFSMT